MESARPIGRGRDEATALLMAMMLLLASVAGDVGLVPEIGFVLQLSGLGALIGGLISYLVRRRDPEADVWWITTRATLLAASAGVLIVLIDALR